MIYQYKYSIEKPKFIKPINSAESVRVHGYLFSILPAKEADLLHDDTVPKPYSIRYERGNKNDFLYINCLNELAEEIPKALHKKGSIHMDGSERPCTILQCVSKSIAFQAEVKKITADTQQNWVDLIFKSPATYREGPYSNWFDLDKLLRTPIAKLNAYEGIEQSFNTPLMEQLIIKDYALHSASYKVNGIIKGMSGHITFKVKEQEDYKKLLQLLYYSRYAGIGAKTALGMGGVDIKILPYKH